MIAVDDIEDMLQIAIYSGKLAPPEKPLSLIIIAPVGCGKTSMIKKTHKKGRTKKVKVPGRRKNEERETEVRQIVGSVLYTTNVTPYILYTRYGTLLKSGQIHHIAIPDFISVLGQPKPILEGHVKFYNSLVEEGVLSIESRDGSFISEVSVTIGLITAIAQEDFDNRKKTWGAIGFLSRLLPVSYDYANPTAQRIRDKTKIKDYLNEIESFDINLPEATFVNLPLNYANDIEQVMMRCKDPKDKLGVRRQKQLQVFCMANALMNGRDAVNQDDVDKLVKYGKYFNTDCTALL